MRETPLIASSTYASNTVGLGDFQGIMMQGTVQPDLHQLAVLAAQRDEAVRQYALAPRRQTPSQSAQGAIIMPAPTTARRLVQVFIADPDENVPLADCLLYSGEQKLTDLTDQELFFEVDIKSILEAHNDKRVTLVNKVVKERTEYLEPARIRDLKMTVVTIAQF
jgi:hypothetical protein